MKERGRNTADNSPRKKENKPLAGLSMAAISGLKCGLTEDHDFKESEKISFFSLLDTCLCYFLDSKYFQIHQKSTPNTNTAHYKHHNNKYRWQVVAMTPHILTQ
jgi:hypothetical protein